MNIPERDILYLRDMLKYAREAVSFARETTLDGLRKDVRTMLALERAIEIVGEAAKSVSAVTKEQLTQLPWRDMARTQDFFAHHYFKIDVEVLWRITEENLPELIEVLESVLPESPN